MLQAAELTTVSDGGQVNTLPLAAAYTRVWTLPAGILLTVGQPTAAASANTLRWMRLTANVCPMLSRLC